MDKYTATHNMRLLQERAEVDAGIAEAVVAYTRLCTDRGVAPVFFESDQEANREIDNASWLHADFLKRNKDLDPRVLAFFVGYGKELIRRRLPVMFRPEDVAFKLGISMRQLNWLAYAKEGRYHQFERKKSSGGTRILHAPTSKLKTVQRWITKRILLKSPPHRYATAYYPGRALSNNAMPHVKRAVVVRMDLKDFFPSVTFQQVRRVFSSFGYPYGVAGVLANLCCHEGRLVQGAPSSPALSNLVARRLDQRITGIKKRLKEEKHKFYYSRYADDLIFSFEEEKLLCTLPLIRQIIREEGFVANEGKLRIMRSGRQQKVTGMVVNSRVNVPAKDCRILRAVLHNIQHRGLVPEMERWESANRVTIHGAEHFYRILQGRIAFVRSINPEKGDILLDRLKALDISQFNKRSGRI